ncbi:MAG TPA: ECF transporter S component [Bacillota bacterium]|nr:ECF transporter S component [Bacillota bacterium]HOR87069.1 ECF transporter S component [Bacillota bacterium]HPL53203.1 ECF transporter S component [Bacillota bacterium]
MLAVKEFDVRKMSIVGVLGGISAILGMTPLGFIPVGPTRATIMHIPVIIGAIMEGPVVGGLAGLIFGLFSIFQALTNPTPVSFVFLNPLVSVVPRVLIGITSYYTFKALNNLGHRKTLGILNAIWILIIGYLGYGIYGNIKSSQSSWLLAMNIALIVLAASMAFITNRKFKDKALDIVVASIVGTLTNTVLVLSLIYLMYAENFVKAIGQSPELARRIIVGIGVANGIPETIIAILIVTSVVGALRRRTE